MLLEAWRLAALPTPARALVLVGTGSGRAAFAPAGLRARGRCGDRLASTRSTPAQLRDVYAACDVLVVPSIPTRTFREPWGLVVNEAMNRGLAVIASDAVGAAAGGLVRDGVNGLVVPAGDSGALARGDRAPGRRYRSCARGSVAQAAQDVRAYSYDAWARGLLASAGKPRPRPRALVALRRCSYENRPLQEPARPRWPWSSRSSCSAARRRRSADIGAKIIERCTHGESLGGFSQQAYRRALKELPTEVEEYSDCANLIRRAQLAASGRGGGAGARRRRAGRHSALVLGAQRAEHTCRAPAPRR